MSYKDIIDINELIIEDVTTQSLEKDIEDYGREIAKIELTEDSAKYLTTNDITMEEIKKVAKVNDVSIEFMEKLTSESFSSFLKKTKHFFNKMIKKFLLTIKRWQTKFILFFSKTNSVKENSSYAKELLNTLKRDNIVNTITLISDKDLSILLFTLKDRLGIVLDRLDKKQTLRYKTKIYGDYKFKNFEDLCKDSTIALTKDTLIVTGGLVVDNVTKDIIQKPFKVVVKLSIEASNYNFNLFNELGFDFDEYLLFSTLDKKAISLMLDSHTNKVKDEIKLIELKMEKEVDERLIEHIRKELIYKLEVLSQTYNTILERYKSISYIRSKVSTVEVVEAKKDKKRKVDEDDLRETIHEHNTDNAKSPKENIDEEVIIDIVNNSSLDKEDVEDTIEEIKKDKKKNKGEDRGLKLSLYLSLKTKYKLNLALKHMVEVLISKNDRKVLEENLPASLFENMGGLINYIASRPNDIYVEKNAYIEYLMRDKVKLNYFEPNKGIGERFSSAFSFLDLNTYIEVNDNYTNNPLFNTNSSVTVKVLALVKNNRFKDLYELTMLPVAFILNKTGVKYNEQDFKNQLVPFINFMLTKIHGVKPVDYDKIGFEDYDKFKSFLNDNIGTNFEVKATYKDIKDAAIEEFKLMYNDFVSKYELPMGGDLSYELIISLGKRYAKGYIYLKDNEDKIKMLIEQLEETRQLKVLYPDLEEYYILFLTLSDAYRELDIVKIIERYKKYAKEILFKRSPKKLDLDSGDTSYLTEIKALQKAGSLPSRLGFIDNLRKDEPKEELEKFLKDTMKTLLKVENFYLKSLYDNFGAMDEFTRNNSKIVELNIKMINTVIGDNHYKNVKMLVPKVLAKFILTISSSRMFINKGSIKNVRLSEVLSSNITQPHKDIYMSIENIVRNYILVTLMETITTGDDLYKAFINTPVRGDVLTIYNHLFSGIINGGEEKVNRCKLNFEELLVSSEVTSLLNKIKNAKPILNKNVTLSGKDLYDYVYLMAGSEPALYPSIREAGVNRRILNSISGNSLNDNVSGGDLEDSVTIDQSSFFAWLMNELFKTMKLTLLRDGNVSNYLRTLLASEIRYLATVHKENIISITYNGFRPNFNISDKEINDKGLILTEVLDEMSYFISEHTEYGDSLYGELTVSKTIAIIRDSKGKPIKLNKEQELLLTLLTGCLNNLDTLDVNGVGRFSSLESIGLDERIMNNFQTKINEALENVLLYMRLHHKYTGSGIRNINLVYEELYYYLRSLSKDEIKNELGEITARNMNDYVKRYFTKALKLILSIKNLTAKVDNDEDALVLYESKIKWLKNSIESGRFLPNQLP